MNASYCNQLKGTCIEADEFGGKNNVIRAKPTDNSQYTMKGNYKHNTFTQKINQTDLGLSLNGEPITINITGKWMPWFGDLSESELKKYNTNENFICAIEKYKINDIGGQKLTFSNNDEENEFWYIKNYYSEIKTPTKDTKNNKIIIEGIEEPPERQKECWIVGGVGLYLGSFGINGRTEPSAYHHLKASKLICNKGHWFNGEAGKNGVNINMNYVITTYGNEANQKSYKMSDFIKNYFSVSYYSDPEGYLQNYNVTKNWESSEAPYDDGIFEETDNQIIYHIDVHEKNLESRLKNNRDSDSSKFNEFNKNISYGYIVANSISKFMQACYQISKDIGGDTSRVYMSYFQYGPKKLYKNIENVQDIPYEYGEKIKMLIVDKFYENNQGFYQIEIISGIQFDDSDSIEKKIREVEFYLLGTPGEKNRRSGGIIERIFNNLLSETFKNFAKAILVLYVIYYGFRVIFGFKKDRNDRSVVNNKDLMITLFKFIIITIFLTSDNVYLFFSETILSFVVDGIIGIIDLIAGIFSNSFITNDNISSLTGGLKYANEIKSLARNFSIVDEILNFFTEKVIIAKVMAFTFNFTQTFGSGLIISIGILMVLILYIFKLVQSIVPFIFVLVQLAIVLPLAPLFILFSLFKETSYIFQNWLKFILSKCLELIGFFTAFYFCTSFINNFIKQLLNYRVCFIGLGDKLFPEVDNEIGVDSVSDFFEGNWAKEILKKIFNRFLAISIEGLPDNYFIWYVANILITALLVIMFDTLIKEVMNIINNILTIDGATANTGGKNAMLAATTGEFSISKQFKNFGSTMGLAALQKESGILRTTKAFLDLEKGLGGNLLAHGKRIGSGFKAGVEALTGDKEKAKRTLTKNGLLDYVKPLTGIPFVGNKIGKKIDNIKADVEAYKERKKREGGKWSKTFKQIKNIWSSNKVKSEVTALLSRKGNKALRKHLESLKSELSKKIFGQKMASKISGNIKNISGEEASRIKDYLQKFAANEYNRKGMADLNYDVFSDNYGKSNRKLIIESLKSKDKKGLMEAIRNSKNITLKSLFGKNNMNYLTELRENDDIDYEIEDYIVENMQKYLEMSSYGSKGIYYNIVSGSSFKKEDPNNNEILVKDDEGEEYKIKLEENSDGNKKVETSAIFDQDGTKIFEVKDANCILKVDNVEYIITSTEDNGTIVSIAKEDGTTKELTKEEKNAALQAKIEKKLEKFNKMMKEAEEFEKNNHSEK